MFEGAIAIVCYLVPPIAWFLGPVGLLIIAVRLGLRYGRLLGTTGAVVPLALLWVEEAIRRAVTTVPPEQVGQQDSLVGAAVVVFAAMLMVGFIAFLAGALADRYSRG